MRTNSHTNTHTPFFNNIPQRKNIMSSHHVIHRHNALQTSNNLSNTKRLYTVPASNRSGQHTTKRSQSLQPAATKRQ
jgi:hypothetical protein